MRIVFSFLLPVALAMLPGGCIDLSDPGALVPPTADQDPLLPQVRVEVAGHTRALHLENFGDPANPAVLVLHGAASDFRGLKVFRALTDRYFIVLWDQRGSGLSERVTADEITWAAAVEEIDAVREIFSLDRPVTLIGHSWGGAYAAMYLGRRPGVVRQAVLIEPLALTGGIMEGVFDEMFELRMADEVYNDMGFFNRVLTPDDHARLDYRYLLQIKTNMTNFSCDPKRKPNWPVWRAGAFAEYVRQGRIATGITSFDYDYTEGLKRFEPEVLIVASECSALGYDFQEEQHLPLFNSARVERIENAGHSLIVEDTEAMLEVIREYLVEYR